jgi:hypothetical protein
MSWGLLRPTPKGWGLSPGTIQGRSHFSLQGQLDSERDSLCPSCGQPATTPATQLATALDTLTPQSGAQKEAPNYKTANMHRWPHTSRDTTWGRLGQSVSGESQECGKSNYYCHCC